MKDKSVKIKQRRTSEEAIPSVFGEQLYQNIIESMQDVYYRTDIHGNLVFISPSGPKLLGYASSKELIGKDIATTFYAYPNDREKFLSAIKKKGYVKNYEIILKRKDGNLVNVSTNSNFYYDKQNNLLGIEGFFRDITNLKKTEKKYEILFNSTPDVIAEYAEDGTIVTVNPAMAKSLGVSVEMLAGKNVKNIKLKDEIEARIKITENVFKTGKKQAFEDQRGGRYFHNIFVPIKNLDGEKSIQVIARDITEVKKAEMILKRSSKELERLVQKRTDDLRKTNTQLRCEIVKREKIEEALKESEELYRTLIKTSPEAVTVTDLDGHIIEVSEHTLELHGFSTVEELLGKSSFKLIAPKDRKKAAENLQKTFTDNCIRNIEYTLLRKDGSHFLGELNVSLIKDSKGNKKAFIATVRDVTQRKEMMEKLEITSNAIKSSISPIAISDIKGNLTYVNSAFIKAWGYDDENEVLGKSAVLFWTEKTKAATIEKLINGGSYIGELIAERKDGSFFNTQISAITVNDKRDKPIGMVTSFLDITKCKIAEERLLSTKGHLQNIVNSASEIIITIDQNNRVTTWNKTTELLTGYKEREILGRDIQKLDVFVDIPFIQYHIKKVHEGTIPSFDEFILKTKNNGKKIIQVSSSCILDSRGKNEGVLFVGRDITHDVESHGKLINGMSYLIPDKDSESALHIFTDFVTANHSGLLITRRRLDTLSGITAMAGFQCILLQQEELDGSQSMISLDELFIKIKEFCLKNKNAVLFLDHVGYLLSCFSFEQFIRFLYRLTDIVSKYQSVLLLNLNPLLVDKRQMAVIEEELQVLPGQKMEGLTIQDELYDILQFIYEQNQNNALVFYKKVSKAFSIVHTTTVKRLKNLENNGLIYIKKRGRLKTVHISEKGKKLLQKRRII